MKKYLVIALLALLILFSGCNVMRSIQWKVKCLTSERQRQKYQENESKKDKKAGIKCPEFDN